MYGTYARSRVSSPPLDDTTLLRARRPSTRNDLPAAFGPKMMADDRRSSFPSSERMTFSGCSESFVASRLRVTSSLNGPKFPSV